MLIECVPNVSEGRDMDLLNQLADSITEADEAILLNRHSDPDHHRTVFTFAGSFDGVINGAFQLVEAAMGLLDISHHAGVHPRMGLVDVCPFIPLDGTPMAAAISAAHALGERVARDLAIPVYFYGEAARSPRRRALPHIRRFNFQALQEAIQDDPERAPDLGPKKLHPRFGAMAIGARPPMVAYNIELDSPETDCARKIAQTLREKDGGLPGVRALGFALDSIGKSQASFNITQTDRTGPLDVFQAGAAIAGDDGVPINRSELVGMLFKETVYKDFAKVLKLTPFGADDVLEEKLNKALPLFAYLKTVADPAGGPGGGAIASDTGALAAGLLAFVAGIADRAHPLTADFKKLALSFQFLSQKDQAAYQAFSQARKMPRGDARKEAMAGTLQVCCNVPLRVLACVLKTCEAMNKLDVKGAIAADLKIAAKLLDATAESALETLNVNLKAKATAPYAEDLRKAAEACMTGIRALL